MSRVLHKVSVAYVDHVFVRDDDGAGVTGLTGGDFTAKLYKDGASDATSVTVVEVSDGCYAVSFTPGSTGVWFLHMWQTANPLRRWQATLEVTTDGGFSGTPQTGDSYARLGAPAGASVSADVAAIKAETGAVLEDTGTTIPVQLAAIEADTQDLQGRLPAALVAGRIDASVGAVETDAIGADAVSAAAVAKIQNGLEPDALLDRENGVEAGVTVRDALRRIGATTAGKCTLGLNGDQATFTGLDGATPRVVATTNDDGERTEIAYS